MLCGPSAALGLSHLIITQIRLFGPARKAKLREVTGLSMVTYLSCRDGLSPHINLAL